MIHADDPFFRVYTYWNILLGVELPSTWQVCVTFFLDGFKWPFTRFSDLQRLGIQKGHLDFESPGIIDDLLHWKHL